MNKFFYTIVLFLFAISSMNAEIKLIQLKVLDNVASESTYRDVALFGSFPMDDQTSFVLPVKNKKVQGMNMPFIKGYGHDVLLVGPFLDMCGDIQILDQSNNVKATIKPASFTAKGKKDFWFPNERRKKNEGFVQFRITKANMDRITTQNFKIKVGNVENLDVVECLVADRFEIDAILFTGSRVPRREQSTSQGVSTIKNTFDPNSNYEIKLKIKDGIIPRYSFKLHDNHLLYHHSSTQDCRGNFRNTGTITKSKLIVDNDAAMIKLSSTNSMQLERRSLRGYMIALIDGKIGTLTKITLDKNAEGVPFGAQFSHTQEPDSWGPYIFARISKDIFKFGQYTDLGFIIMGNCVPPRAPSSGSDRQILIEQQSDRDRGIR